MASGYWTVPFVSWSSCRRWHCPPALKVLQKAWEAHHHTLHSLWSLSPSGQQPTHKHKTACLAKLQCLLLLLLLFYATLFYSFPTPNIIMISIPWLGTQHFLHRPSQEQQRGQQYVTSGPGYLGVDELGPAKEGARVWWPVHADGPWSDKSQCFTWIIIVKSYQLS